MAAAIKARLQGAVNTGADHHAPLVHQHSAPPQLGAAGGPSLAPAQPLARSASSGAELARQLQLRGTASEQLGHTRTASLHTPLSQQQQQQPQQQQQRVPSALQQPAPPVLQQPAPAAAAGAPDSALLSGAATGQGLGQPASASGSPCSRGGSAAGEAAPLPRLPPSADLRGMVQGVLQAGNRALRCLPARLGLPACLCACVPARRHPRPAAQRPPPPPSAARS